MYRCLKILKMPSIVSRILLIIPVENIYNCCAKQRTKRCEEKIPSRKLHFSEAITNIENSGSVFLAKELNSNKFQELVVTSNKSLSNPEIAFVNMKPN